MKDRLANLTFPCYLVAYASERNYRTTYRSECPGAFNSGMVNSVEEAEKLIDGAQFRGHASSEIKFISINIVTDEDGTRLQETEV